MRRQDTHLLWDWDPDVISSIESKQAHFSRNSVPGVREEEGSVWLAFVNDGRDLRGRNMCSLVKEAIKPLPIFWDQH